MNIRIRSIHVAALGPIDEFSREFNDITLIYGKNEVGKTFLVEFILRSLFKNIRGFGFREINTKGKIEIEGLDNKSLMFSENSKKKIEDYLDSKDGFPPNLANLVVVKGADVRLDKTSKAGLSAEFIKHLLSGKSTLDAVLEKIKQKTVREAIFEDGVVDGARRGKIAELYDLEFRIQQLDSLITKINNEYSLGELHDIVGKKNLVEDYIEEYAQAKRYKAYQVSQRILELETSLREYHEKDLDGLSANVERCFQSGEVLRKRRKEYEEKSKGNHLYEWLDKAIPELSNLIHEYGGETKLSGIYVSSAILASGVILVIASFVAAYLFVSFPVVIEILLEVFGLVLLIIGGLLLGATSRKAVLTLRKSGIGREIDEIKDRFKDKFQLTEADIASMKQQLEKYRESYFASKNILADIHDLEKEVSTFEVTVVEGFKRLGVEVPQVEKWREVVNRLSGARNNEISAIENQKGILEGLEVPPGEYTDLSAKVEYDYEEYSSVEKRFKELATQFNELSKRLDGLKREIAGALGISDYENFTDLLDRLKSERMSAGQEYKDLKSELIAKILMTRVIERSNQEEVEKIKTVLSSEEVSRPLKNITKKYEEIEYSDGEFFVADRFNRYRLSDLSTGAIEQVFTALRIGLSSHSLGNRSGFLIFDDAFQHSDWDRRPNLIKQLLEIQKGGWQVIYFSMDDHIKRLFEQIVKGVARDKFLLIELPGN